MNYTKLTDARWMVVNDIIRKKTVKHFIFFSLFVKTEIQKGNNNNLVGCINLIFTRLASHLLFIMAHSYTFEYA